MPTQAATQSFTPEAIEFLRSLKSTLEMVYSDGIDRLLTCGFDGKQISGRFVDGRKIFDYAITSAGVEYVPIKSRTDAYTEGLVQQLALRNDKGKQRQCTGGKSYSCGATCISDDYVCRMGNPQVRVRSAELLKKIPEIPPFAKGVMVGIAPGLIAGGAVAALGLYVGIDMAARNKVPHVVFRRKNGRIHFVKSKGTKEVIREVVSKHGGKIYETTPHQNQAYDKSFPDDAEFSKAKYNSLDPVSSGAKQKGTHAIFKTKIGDKEFFVKKASELAIAKEVSSYEIAKAVGLGDSVLPARRVYKDGVSHVANPLLNQDDVEKLDGEAGIKKAVQNMPHEAVAERLLYDYTIHNKDRHSGNILFKKDGKDLLIDHGAVKWDVPDQISATLETRKNVFYRYGMGGNPNAEVPPETLRKFVASRQKVKKIMEYRYAGQPKIIVDPIMENLDRRFDVMESMLHSGDTRIKHLINGETVGARSRSETFGKKAQIGRSVNGLRLSTSDPDAYQRTPDNPDIKVPDWPEGISGARKKTGAIVVEPDGRLWIYEPKNHYAGTEHTFAKGGAEPELTDQQNALKEIREELGLEVKLIDHLGDFSHKTGERVKPGDKHHKAVIRHFVAVRTGGAPWDAHWEADNVKLVPPDKAQELFNKERDKKILASVGRYTTSSSGIQKLRTANDEVREKASNPWRASMNRQDADEWANLSAYKKPTYHATSEFAANAISQGGFDLSFRSVGRVYGNGVYLGTKESDIRPYKKLYEKNGGKGEVLELRTNLGRVLDISDEIKRAQKRSPFAPNRPIQAMEGIAENLGSKQDYERQIRFLRKQNRKLKTQLKAGLITEAEYNRQYAHHPRSEAFSHIVQRAGYDAIKLRGGRANIPMLVVYDPKNITVVKEDE